MIFKSKVNLYFVLIEYAMLISLEFKYSTHDPSHPVSLEILNLEIRKDKTHFYLSKNNFEGIFASKIYKLRQIYLIVYKVNFDC